MNRFLEKGIQHVVEQGKAAFAGFQVLFDVGFYQSLRDELRQRCPQFVQGQRAALVQIGGWHAVFQAQDVHHEFKYLFVARHGEALIAIGVVARARRFLLRPGARLFAVRAGADAGVVGEFRLFKDAGVGLQGNFAAVRQGA